MTETTQYGNLNPKNVGLNIALDIATLLVGHMDGYCLQDKNPFATVDGFPEGHKGSKPIRIDKYLGDTASEIVKLPRIEELTLGGAMLFQEEAVQTSYVADSETRRFRVVVDPLDGSKIYSAFGVGGVSVLVYFIHPEKRVWQLQAGCVAVNSGYAFSYKLQPRFYQPANGTVRAEVAVARFDNRPLSKGQYEPVELLFQSVDIEHRNFDGRAEFVLASTAGSQKRRESLQGTLSSLSQSIGLLGSFAANLSVWGAVMGQTSVIVDPDKSTMHDGNYLLILQSLNWLIVDANTGEEVPLLALAEEHCDPSIAQEARIPPVFAFRNEKVKREWLEKINK